MFVKISQVTLVQEGQKAVLTLGEEGVELSVQDLNELGYACEAMARAVNSVIALDMVNKQIKKQSRGY